VKPSTPMLSNCTASPRPKAADSPSALSPLHNSRSSAVAASSSCADSSSLVASSAEAAVGDAAVLREPSPPFVPPTAYAEAAAPPAAQHTIPPAAQHTIPPAAQHTLSGAYAAAHTRVHRNRESPHDLHVLRSLLPQVLVWTSTSLHFW
jgi:hypothetical protein